jgi:ribosomal protein S18 acetylase RimI-like enzyme
MFQQGYSCTVISIEPLSLRLLEPFKAVRLTALEDTPTAFGSTFARESQFSHDDWLNRVSAWNNNRSVCYIAMDGDSPCGIAAGKCDEFDEYAPQRVHLLSMWVAPAHRRAGLGTRLVIAVELWARDLGIRNLCLMVTSKNSAAISFYKRYGFAFTGKTAPYPNDSAIFEYEMAKSLCDS